MCEFGEQCADAACEGGTQCKADCPFPVKRCPADEGAPGGGVMPCSGHGTCNLGTGTCTCFRGYVGDACKRCDTQYFSSSGACRPMPGAMVRHEARFLHAWMHTYKSCSTCERICRPREPQVTMCQSCDTLQLVPSMHMATIPLRALLRCPHVIPSTDAHPSTPCFAGQVSCSNGRRDGNEEGIDCGGPNCPPCTVFMGG